MCHIEFHSCPNVDNFLPDQNTNNSLKIKRLQRQYKKSPKALKPIDAYNISYHIMKYVTLNLIIKTPSSLITKVLNPSPPLNVDKSFAQLWAIFQR